MGRWWRYKWITFHPSLTEFRDLLVEKFKDSKVETFIGTFTA
ncbi:hypothetical protein ECP02989422_4735 [Escherichia coli P0298942.2]|nr:hypothetical protein ECP02989421_5216 [Escherichia coli P0298942.1]ENA88799.1 hypothetical protein EC2862600_4905 [Escherichia coli 2862600]ENB33265.1 hypothetical protein ECP029894210_4839 [Escherichia coli P0298942.10]ENB42811.1 hypothetical protein ECP029894211_4965 [Escherichia coli P0298942.11]ENB49515.1 hypothetical protein ECP029894214_4881 [Escherichia coli P0298942.14]ENB50272.1 hypothetical protein ECP029894212_5204 [Escherichia coli P0298942.12]ENB55690.1 hypothetical protein EC